MAVLCAWTVWASVGMPSGHKVPSPLFELPPPKRSASLHLALQDYEVLENFKNTLLLRGSTVSSVPCFYLP